MMFIKFFSQTWSLEYRIHTYCSAIKNGTVVRGLWIQRIAFHSPNFASKACNLLAYIFQPLLKIL